MVSNKICLMLLFENNKGSRKICVYILIHTGTCMKYLNIIDEKNKNNLVLLN